MDGASSTPGPGGEGGFKALALKSLMESTPLFSDTNYSIWRKKMERLFKMRGILHLVNSPNPYKEIPDNNEMAGYLMSKLDPATHTNIITIENEGSTKLIWQAAKDHFASNEAANRARMFFNFLYLAFDSNDIDGFVTNVKLHLGKLDKVGIELPGDILSYLILFKLPESLNSIRSQIMHSGADLSVNFILNHLVQHRNEVQSKAQESTAINSALYHSGATNSDRP